MLDLLFFIYFFDYQELNYFWTYYLLIIYKIKKINTSLARCLKSLILKK